MIFLTWDFSYREKPYYFADGNGVEIHVVDWVDSGILFRG
jgi:hypothetical protein